VFLTIADLDSPLGRGGHPQLFALLDPKRHIFTADGYVGLYNQRRKPVKRRAGDPDESTRWLALHKVDLDLTHQIQSLPLATELAHAPFPAIAAHESIRVDGPGGTLVFRHFTTARTVASRSESGESNLLQRCREQPRRLDADLGPQSLGPYTPPTQE